MKILIIGPAWVGDMVMAQSLFIVLRQLHPQCLIDVLAPDWTRPLLERMPEIRNAIAMPLGHGDLGLGMRRRLGKQLAKEQYDRAIVLPNSFKSALIPRFAGIPQRTGWRGEMRGWLLNDCRRLDKSRYGLMVQRFNALAYDPDTEPEAIALPEPQLAVEPGSVSEAREAFDLDTDGPVVIFCPGAEYGPSKQWPAEHFVRLATELIQRGSRVWLMGSSGDREDCQYIWQTLAPDHQSMCSNLAGLTSLAQAIDLMSLADSVVSNDSGLMHVAAALQRPMVVIYGSTSSAFTPPLTETAQVLSLGLECSPCFKRKCPLHHHRCMLDLKPDSVLSALAKCGQVRLINE